MTFEEYVLVNLLTIQNSGDTGIAKSGFVVEDETSKTDLTKLLSYLEKEHLVETENESYLLTPQGYELLENSRSEIDQLDPNKAQSVTRIGDIIETKENVTRKEVKSITRLFFIAPLILVALYLLLDISYLNSEEEEVADPMPQRMIDSLTNNGNEDNPQIQP